MATDKLINQSQGDDIIDALDDIATNLGNISYGEQTSSDKVVAMTGYQKESTTAAISPGDSLNVAIGKLEKKVDDNATAITDKVDGPESAVVGNIATFASVDGKSVQDSEVAIVTTMDDTSDAEVPTSEAIGEYISDQKFVVGLDSSTANHLVKFKDNNGKNLEDTGIDVETSSASALSDDDVHIPTSKLVKTEVDKKVTSIKAPVSGSSTKVDKNNEVAFQQASGQSPAVTVTGDATNGTVTIAHQTGSGFNHLPKSGADGKYLKWKTGDDGEWVAPDSTWAVNPDNKTIPGTKLVDDRFKTNETDIQSMQSDIAALEGLSVGRLKTTARNIISEEFVEKTWGGSTSLRNGSYIWSDGTNIYYSNGSYDQYVLDKDTNTWNAKTWTGLPRFNGNYIWSDGENVYFSDGSSHYVLDKSTSTWNTKTWSGLTDVYGNFIWSDGTNIYHSYDTHQYVLNKSTSTWSAKTWNGLTDFDGDDIWSDGTNIYYSEGSNQYVLNKATSTWSVKTWSGLTSYYGSNVWTDGNNIYFSNGSSSDQYVLDKSTSTWTAKTWTGLTSFYGRYIWTDGTNIYYSNMPDYYVLKRNNPNTREVMGYVNDQTENKVSGPGSSCTNAIAIYSDTTGKVLADSEIYIETTQLNEANDKVPTCEVVENAIFANAVNLLNDISYNTNMGVKNAATITDFEYVGGIEGGNYSITCAPLTGDILIKCGSIASTDTDGSTCLFLLYFTDGTSSSQQLSRGTNIEKSVSLGTKVLSKIVVYPASNYTNSKNDTITVSNLMVCSKAIYDQDSSYASGASSNAQLTSSILTMCDVGAKNLVNHIDLATTLTGNATGITLTPNDDGSITLNGTSSASSAVIYARCFIKGTVKSNTNYIVYGTNSSNVHVQLLAYDSSGNMTLLANEMGITTVNSGAYARYEARIWIKAKPSSGTQFSNLKIYPMICEESLFNINSAPTPCALSNYDLTQLEADDRAGLIECVDGGAKNLLSIEGETRTVNQVTATYNSDGSITTSGTASGGNANFTIRTYTAAEAAKLSGLVLSGCPSGGSTDTWRLILQKNSANYDVYAEDTGNGAVVGTVPSVACVLILQIKSGYSKNATWYPMLCTKAAFGVSKAFVPYRPPYDTVVNPFFTVPINHNMIYRGKNLGATLTDAQHTALSSGNFTDLYLGDYWTKTVTIPGAPYTGGDGELIFVPAQTNITLKAVIADFDTFYAGYNSSYAGINTHHAAVIVTGFSNVNWNGTDSTVGGYLNSVIHKWLVGSALPQIETWFGSAKVLSHQKLLTNAITGDAASGWAWSSQKISLLSENQMYGSKVWGNSKASNGGYEPGEAFKHLNVFNHIDANLLFGNKTIWLRDIASAVGVAYLNHYGNASYYDASITMVAPAALILLS